MTRVKSFSSVASNTAKTTSAFVPDSIFSRHEFSPIKSITRFPCRLPPIPPYSQSEKFIIEKFRDLKVTGRMMKRDGPGSLMLVTDFDHTLTKSYHADRRASSSLEFLRNAFLPPEEIAEITSLHKKNKALQSANLLNFESKVLKKQEKIELEIKLLTKAKINIEKLAKTPIDAPIVPRARFDSLLKLYDEHKLPFHMVSAGISNIIVSMLDQYTNLKEYENIHLYSNEMIFDDKGVLVGFKKPYMHLYKKNQILQQQGPVRKNIILLGDLLSDTYMAVNLRPRNLITIGYLNYGILTEENSESTMRKYTKQYDILLGPEASLELPERLTRYLLDLESEETFFKYLEDNLCTEEEANKNIFSLAEKSKLIPKPSQTTL